MRFASWAVSSGVRCPEGNGWVIRVPIGGYLTGGAAPLAFKLLGVGVPDWPEIQRKAGHRTISLNCFLPA